MTNASSSFVRYACAITLAAAFCINIPTSFADTSSSSSSSSSSVSADGVTVSVTDGLDHVTPGSYITYAVTVQQSVSPSKTVDVSLTLPSYINTVTPSDNGRQVGNLILWDNVTLNQNTAKILTASINLQQNIPDNTQLVATAQAGNDQAKDTTVVTSSQSAPAHPFQVSITDNTTSATPGQALTYTVTVRNSASFSEHADVNVSFSGQVAISDSDPPATISYPSVTWSNVSFAGNEQKTFTVHAKVNNRITAYSSIHAVASADGTTASDTTTVVPYGSISSSSSSSSSVSSSSSSSLSAGARSVLFRKVADSSEVVPGGTVKYTLYVQNILLNVIHNATITDKFDPTMMSVQDAGGGTLSGGNELQWTLPTLQPGQIWKTSYTMKVASGVANGTTLNNVATLGGTDVSAATLSEKVMVANASVVGTLPTTGASYDLVFLPLIALLALGSMLLQRQAH